MDVVQAGEADRPADSVRISRRKIRRVIRAEACSVHGKVAALGTIEDVRHHLIPQIRVELRVPRRADRRVNPAVVPALRIDRVDTDELNFPAIHLVRQ